jgi:hypothetical protein
MFVHGHYSLNTATQNSIFKLGGSMVLSTGNWLTIIGITVAIVFGLVQIIKTKNKKNNQIEIKQKMGSFSSGSQSVNIDNRQVDEND